MAVTAFPHGRPKRVVAITTAAPGPRLRIGTARPSTMRSRCAAISAASSASASLRLIELAKKKTPGSSTGSWKETWITRHQAGIGLRARTRSGMFVSALGIEWHWAPVPAAPRRRHWRQPTPGCARLCGTRIEVDPASRQRSGREPPPALRGRLGRFLRGARHQPQLTEDLRSGDAVLRYLSVAGWSRRARCIRPKDTVDLPCVSEVVQPALHFGDILAPCHRPAVVEEAVTEHVAGFVWARQVSGPTTLSGLRRRDC